MSAPVFIHAGVSEAAAGDVVTLGGAEGKHAATVQRRGIGERVDLVDGRGRRAHGLIVEARSGEIDVEVLDLTEDDDPALVLVQALAKGGRDEQAVETATELGVTRVVPWSSRRAIVQWRGPKADKGRRSWQDLAVAAAKQSRRATVPVVDAVVDTSMLVRQVSEAVAMGSRVLVLHEQAQHPLTGLTWDDPSQEVWLIVGPEGGIGDDELDRLVGAGAESVLLGPHVLRASTAGPAAMAALAAARGTWAARAQ